MQTEYQGHRDARRSIRPGTWPDFRQAIFLFVLSMLFSGCSSPPEPRELSRRGETGGHSREHDHEHEHEEHGGHGHEDPDHKPASFPAAVERLKQLRGELAGSRSGREADWQIALDIVDWLPELAADSEIREADWNQVDNSSQALRKIMAGAEPSSTDWERFDAELNRLSDCVLAYQAAEAKFLRRLGTETAAGEE